MEKYQYTLSDRIVDPHKYFYTEYEGESFLAKWADDRSKFSSFRPSGDLPLSDPDLSPEEVSRRLETGQVEASDLLLCLYDDLSGEAPSPSAYDLARRLVKRFEVFKRIHSGYRKGFRAVDRKQFHDPQLYIYAAFVFEKAYSNTLKLYYLNAFHKVVDTLSSIAPELNPEQSGNAAWLVEQESRHIQVLTAKIESMKS